MGDNDTAATSPSKGEAEFVTAPDAVFTPGAKKSLAPVSRQLSWIAKETKRGHLQLDPAAAHRLLAVLSQLQSQVHTMIANGSERIGPPLRFGDNFVARAMGKRLRTAAVGSSSAAVPVLESFLHELEKLEDIVRRAAVQIRTADDDAKSAFTSKSEEQE